AQGRRSRCWPTLSGPGVTLGLDIRAKAAIIYFGMLIKSQRERMPRVLDQQKMARVNRAACLDLARLSGETSRIQMAHALGCTPTTVTRIVNGLTDRGLLIEGQALRNGRGRPRQGLRLNETWGHVLAVSITHTLTLGVASLGGRIIERRRLASEE